MLHWTTYDSGHVCVLPVIAYGICSWELVTINPGIVFGPVAAPKLAESASVWAPIVEHMNGTR